MKEKKVDKYITNALFELLKVKPLAEISTTELIAKAGVGRSSYYRNFYLLEDIIKQYGQNLFSQISQLPPIALNDPRCHMRQVYEQYLAERERLAILDKQDLLYILDDSLHSFCIDQIENLGMFQGSYQVAFYAGASASVIRAWIHNSFRETPAELAEITYNCLKWESNFKNIYT